MNVFIIIGIILGASVIVTDRYIHHLPNWLAIVLYTLAVVLVITGMIVSRTR
ncbi:MAG: hypothetical protein K6E89_06190 [Sphaerochaetaceae bacterium]|jgi:hypothetical protein|nr:hypothetical protein [Sphaerochaetaceae bacterium]